MKNIVIFILFTFLHSCSIIPFQSKVFTKNKVFSELCKYYDLSSYSQANIATKVTSFDQKINKIKNNSHSMLLYRAIYLSDTGTICYLLLNNIHPTPKEDINGDVIKFFFDNKETFNTNGSEVEVLKMLLHRGYRPPEGLVFNQIFRCHYKNQGMKNIPFVEALLKYIDVNNIKKVDGKSSITISTEKLIQNSWGNNWNGDINSCLQDHRCYTAHRLYQAFQYVKRKRNTNSD
ncbi:MAG: hypothetical protein AAF518_17840 [Spirochaetota bacterium]